MVSRSPLKKQLFKAWQQTMDLDYRDQRINSEHGLQACLWARLVKTLPIKNRLVFIEPHLVLNGKLQGTLYPDIVICNTKQVICVIEIKYQPWKLPWHVGDLKKLRKIARSRESLRVINKRIRGPVDPKEYKFSEDVVFVWAGVYRTPKVSFESKDVSMLSDGAKELQGCFMQLHAETDLMTWPKCFFREN